MTWTQIDELGFYPELVTRSLRRALGGKDPLALLLQLDAGFDHGSLFRHLNVVAISTNSLVQLHVDELEDGGATVASAIHPLGAVRGMSYMEQVTAPEKQGGAVTEITIAVNLGSARRGDVETLQCDDPECVADHGFTISSIPDDLTIRVSVAADGVDALVQAERFVDVLQSMMEHAHD